jgi:hypothetical protein
MPGQELGCVWEGGLGAHLRSWAATPLFGRGGSSLGYYAAQTSKQVGLDFVFSLGRLVRARRALP